MNTIKKGVVAMKDGKYWGLQYDDGRSKHYDFGPLKNAKVSDPEFCKKATDMAPSFQFEQLKDAVLIPITITNTYTLEQ